MSNKSINIIGLILVKCTIIAISAMAISNNMKLITMMGYFGVACCYGMLVLFATSDPYDY